MKLNWVNRRNEEEELNKLNKKILKRENRYYIAEESHQIRKKEGIFKKIAGVKKIRKPSKLREKYPASWLNEQFDEISESLTDFKLNLMYLYKRVKFAFRDFREFAKGNVKTTFIGVLAVVLCGLSIVAYNHYVGYEVYFNGNKLGVVTSKLDFENAMMDVNENLSKWYNNAGVYYEQSISFKRVIISNQKDVLSTNDCETAFYNLDIPLFCKGAVITVDGKETVRVASKENAKVIISSVGSKYNKTSKNETIVKDSTTAENLSYKEKLIDMDSVVSDSDAIKFLEGSKSKIDENREDHSDVLGKINDSKEGTNLVSALTFRESQFSTDEIDYKPALTVKTVKEVTYDKPIAYKTTYIDDSSVNVGKNKVKKEGKKGKKKVTAINTYINGKVVKSVVKNEKVKTKPTTQVVSRGTKPLPPISGSGTFLMPATGTISALNKAGSHAGYRAVDIANPVGTKVYASDTGIVTRASNYGGYGECVDIDHGNGYSTRYGHNSKILVHVGQKVQQGELIALMGSTGRSTGPHCHFEIHINGQNQVILNYFNYLRNGLHVNALQK